MSDERTVIQTERRAGVVQLTIDRPERSNALTASVLAGLAEGIVLATADERVRAVVLTGAGERAFCAGADLRDDTLAGGDKPRVSYADLLRAMLACPVPIIARINGHCVAGGMGLLAASDLAIASDGARFALPEVRVGLFPMQVLAVVRRLIGERALLELALTGDGIDAPAALAAGLLNAVVPATELDARVDALLGSLVAGSPAAQRRGKAALRAIAGRSPEDALPFLESELFALLGGADAREGRRAFAERRAPSWAGA